MKINKQKIKKAGLLLLLLLLLKSNEGVKFKLSNGIYMISNKYT